MLCDESEHFNNLDEQGEVVKFPRFNSSNPLFIYVQFYCSSITTYIDYYLFLIYIQILAQ